LSAAPSRMSVSRTIMGRPIRLASSTQIRAPAQMTSALMAGRLG